MLSLRSSPITDIAPLAGLTNLSVLALDHSAITDLSPLTALTGIKHLYLAGCSIVDYSPLAGIYQNLESKDFIIAYTLEELGFIMDDDSRTACYDSEDAFITVNHSEWGLPMMELEANSIRMRLQFDGGTMTVGYHAEIQTYVFNVGLNDSGHIDYIYDATNDSFSTGDREATEQTVLEALGETDAEDVLLAPIQIFNDRICATFNMTADALYALPFKQTEALLPAQTPPPYALPYEQFGFTAYADRAICLYEQTEPHYMHIAIHRTEWGVSPDEWNIEFLDSNVNGYNLVMQYYADRGRWSVHMERGDADCSFDDYPATDDKGWEYPDIETVHRMVGNAFGSQGKEFYYKPLEYFEQWVQERFGMSLDELYTLPKE